MADALQGMDEDTRVVGAGGEVEQVATRARMVRKKTLGRSHSQLNRAVWFDIPVADLDRAAKFYRAVLSVGVEKEKYGDYSFCVIDHHDGNGGCLVPNAAEIAAGGVMIH